MHADDTPSTVSQQTTADCSSVTSPHIEVEVVEPGAPSAQPPSLERITGTQPSFTGLPAPQLQVSMLSFCHLLDDGIISHYWPGPQRPKWANGLESRAEILLQCLHIALSDCVCPGFSKVMYEAVTIQRLLVCKSLLLLFQI